MKCATCGRETNWDESYGPSDFIICPHCFETMVQYQKEKRGCDFLKAREEVFAMIFLNKE